MRALRMLVASAGVAVVCGMAVLPAQAATPSSPGCTFDQSVGRTTCVSTVTSTQTVGPVTGGGPTSDNSAASQLCIQWDPRYQDDSAYFARDLVVRVTTLTTTTQVYQGRSPGNGSKISSNTTSSTSYSRVDGALLCQRFRPL